MYLTTDVDSVRDLGEPVLQNSLVRTFAQRSKLLSQIEQLEPLFRVPLFPAVSYTSAGCCYCCCFILIDVIDEDDGSSRLEKQTTAASHRPH